MRNVYLPSATATLFIVAALVACHGVGGGYNPTVSQDLSQEPATQEAGSLGIPACKAIKRGAGSWLLFFATGKVKGTTFTAFTGKSSGSEWIVEKWAKVKPTPTPKPT